MHITSVKTQKTFQQLRTTNLQRILKQSYMQLTSSDKHCQLIAIVHGSKKKATLFSGHYLCNRSTLNIGVLGYIGIL
jgi:hypothetical protein